MKKVIKISLAAAAVCFLTTAAHAQLSSDKPAMTVAQMEALRQRPTDQKTASATTAVQTASSVKASQAETPRPVAVKEEPKQAAPATEKVSDQGGVKPVLVAEKTASAEAVVPKVPMQAQQAEKPAKSN